MTPKRVLIVSYYFPPTNAIGALRVGKFAKYLREFGWEPWVLTLDSRLLGISQDLAVEIPAEQVVRADFGPFLTDRVLRRRSGVPAPRGNAAGAAPARSSLKRRAWAKISGMFSDSRLPDRALAWYRPAIRAGDALMRSQRFDAVLSSHGPPGSTIVASVLAGRFNVPWVADLRDLWTQNHSQQNRGSALHAIEQRVERRVMRGARSLVTVSTPLKTQLEQLHGKPVALIPNGFDESDYDARRARPRAAGAPLRIVYTGMIYEGRQEPTPLFKAVRALIDEGTLQPDGVRIEFYGTSPAYVLERAERERVADVVSLSPRIAHAETLDKQVNADVLLLLEWTDPSFKGFFSGKVFEYLGARRPILAIGPRGGVIDQLLQETRAGVMATSAEDVRRALTELLRSADVHGSPRYEGDATAVRRYTRREQARALAAVLNEAAG